MEKIIMPSGYGKTHQLIKKSSESGDYIVCHSLGESIRIQSEAKRIGLHIPLPITYQEFISRNYSSKNIKGFLIDNADVLLESISIIPVNTITMRP